MEHIGKILGLCKGIFWIAAEAKANRKRCRHLAERVKALEELVEAIKRRRPGHITENVNRALWKLSLTLTEAHELVKKCAKTKFVNLLKCQIEFNSVNEGLRDTYHILAGAAHVGQGSARCRMASAHYYPAAAPMANRMPQPNAAVFAASVEVDDYALYYAKAFFTPQ